MNRQRELADRRAFDLRVLSDMRCGTFDFEAYRSSSDLETRRHRVKDREAGADVAYYRWIFHIRTHIERTKFANVTEIGVNTDSTDYPRIAPAVWVLSKDVPWSPHFMKNTPVCIGSEIWGSRGGYITLGELVIHVARMLNWDESGRGPDYSGYNRDAARHHAKAYNGKPINPKVRYPVLPAWLSGAGPSQPGFQVVSPGQRPDPGFRAHR